ncbi:RICIN domain-containing protein [Streptomyces sp. NPDC002537]
MRLPVRAAVAILGAVAAVSGLAAPAAVAAPEPAPDAAVRIHNGAYGGCLTAEGTGYRDPRGTGRPWLVALQPCAAGAPADQSWVYSPATHQYWSVAQPYRCIDRKGPLLVTALCDADSAAQRFRSAPAADGGRKIVSEADGRIWDQDSHRAGAARAATGEGVREARDVASVPADRRWTLTAA